jgi:plastocyanin
MDDLRQNFGSGERWLTLPAFMFLVLLATAACGTDGHALAAPNAPHDMSTAAPEDMAMPGAAADSQAAAVAPAEAAQVRIENFQFSPATLTVPAGTTVTWTNQDGEEHTVTANGRAFSSAGLDTSETFAQRFDTPGTYAYHCALHPHMTAQIIVQ